MVQQDKASLEREYNARRVRRVHYRKQPIKVLKRYQSGMIKQLAYCSDKGFPLECYLIPKVFEHYELLTQFFCQIGATKELLLSKYTASYLGFDDLTDPEYNQYFFEIKKGKPLKKLLSESGTTLMASSIPLFKYWAKELLYAFRDITYKSTYKLPKPISLKNVFVSDIGIKLYLKKIKFGEQRDDNLDYHMHVESQMLKMFAKLLIEMLTNRDDSDNLDRLEIDPELKCILYECLHAEEKTLKKEEERYHNEIRSYIEKESRVQSTKGEDQDLLEEFKELVANQEKQREEEELATRAIRRKLNNPQANLKNYDLENARMGVANEVDLLLSEIKNESKIEVAQKKYSKELMKFSQDTGTIKKEKETKFLTIQGLLDHPYFIQINEADISVVIDEFEKLQLSNENEDN